MPGLLPSVGGLFATLAGIARRRPESPVTIVVDELPYLAQADPALPSVIQRWWDSVRREGLANLKVFLLGSLMAWMEEQTLSERGPLHGRRTGQIRLEPLGYADAALFYPTYSPVERVASYAIWGGLPSYLEAIDPALGLWENVRDAVLQPAVRLADEPSWLRFTDLRSDVAYSSILRAIALGHHRPSGIAAAIGRSRADEVMHHLARLCDLRLVERVVPIHEQRRRHSRHSLYLLADHYVTFWYRYVDRLRHLLGVRRYADALRRIQQDFDKYVSEHAFEDVCRQFLWRALAADSLPPGLEFEAVGSWWVARQDAQDEIDVVATGEGRTVLVGECKWSSHPAGVRDLDGLRASLWKAASDLAPIDRPWRAVFSRSGFDEDLVKLAACREERILLIDPAALYGPGVGGRGSAVSSPPQARGESGKADR